MVLVWNGISWYCDGANVSVLWRRSVVTVTRLQRVYCSTNMLGKRIVEESETNTGRFIMFSVITSIYNKKTKGPTLMELFTATGKLNFFLTTRDVRCVHHGWHGTHRYDIQVLATHASTWVHRYSSLLQWSAPEGQRCHVAMVGRIPRLWHIPPPKKKEIVNTCPTVFL